MLCPVVFLGGAGKAEQVAEGCQTGLAIHPMAQWGRNWGDAHAGAGKALSPTETRQPPQALEKQHPATIRRGLLHRAKTT